MIKNVGKWKSRIQEFNGTGKRGPYFRKMLLLYAVSSLVIFLSFGMIMSVSIQRDYSDQIVRLNEKALYQSVSSCTTTLTNIYNYFYLEILEGAELTEILRSDEYSRELSMRFRDLNTKVMNYSNLVQSCYVINLKGNFACSTMDTYQNLDDFPDRDILARLDAIQESFVTYDLIPRQTHYIIKGTEYDRKYISLIFKKYKEGFLVVNLDYDEFANMVNYRNYNEISRALLVDRNGFVLADSGELLFGEDVSGEEYIQELRKQFGDVGVYEANVDGKKCRIDYYRNQYFGINYIIITNKQILGSNLLLLQMTIYVGVAVLLNLMLITLSTRYLYQPIGKLKEIASVENKNADAPGDEFQTVERAFRDMRRRNREYSDSNRKRVLRSLLEDRNIRGDALLEELGKAQESFDRAMFLCVNLYPNIIKDTEDEWMLMKFAIDNILREQMEGVALLESVDFEHYVTYIINYDISYRGILGSVEARDTPEPGRGLEQIVWILHDLQIRMMEYFHVDVTCSVGSAVNNLNDISDSYEKARMAAFYQLIPENGAILYYNAIPDNMKSDQKYPKELARTIQTAIKAGDKNKVRISVQEFFSLMTHYEYYNATRYILMLEMDVIKLAMKYNLSEDNNWDIAEGLRIGRRLYKMQEIFLKQCLKVADVYRENRDNNPNMRLIVEKVKQLVDDNIRDPNLTVNSIAQEIYLSTSYLRNIFKEVTDQSLSGYIITKRLNEVCRLLMETDWSAQKIADYMGFASRSYLYTFFKNCMGITPGQYRKGGVAAPAEISFIEESSEGEESSEDEEE